MTLKKVGFFQELPYGDRSEPSLKDSLGKLSDPNVERIVGYLRSGHVLMASPGISRDILTADNAIIGSIAILTDGVYMWPKDMSHYVGKYGLAISTEFLEHMKHRQWIMPPVDISKLEY